MNAANTKRQRRMTGKLIQNPSRSGFLLAELMFHTKLPSGWSSGGVPQPDSIVLTEGGQQPTVRAEPGGLFTTPGSRSRLAGQEACRMIIGRVANKPHGR